MNDLTPDHIEEAHSELIDDAVLIEQQHLIAGRRGKVRP
jgi:hypothetical protein